MKSSALRGLKVIHSAMTGGLLLFTVVVFILVYNNIVKATADRSLDNILQVIAIIFSAAGFFAGTAFFKKRLLAIREMDVVADQKFEIYRAASLVQWALLEGPAIFCLICFFLTRNYAFLGLALVLVILFFLLGPSRAKIALQLGLSEDERDSL